MADRQAKPLYVLTLTLDERELAFLEILLTAGRSRPLARRMGRDRETLKRWQDGLRLKLKLAVKRANADRQERSAGPGIDAKPGR